MTLKFTKMHGAGNDFVVLDGVRQSIALSPEQIRYIADRHFGIGCDQILLVERAQFAGSTVEITAVSMGNPHAVQLVDDLDAAPVAMQGPLIEHHPRFPQCVNAGYMQVIDRRRIRLRVWKRGAGETLACGTGACAAVVAGIRRGLLDPIVAVDTRGGRLTIRWEGAENAPNCAVWLTGPAVTVFEGEIQIDER